MARRACGPACFKVFPKVIKRVYRKNACLKKIRLLILAGILKSNINPVIGIEDEGWFCERQCVNHGSRSKSHKARVMATAIPLRPFHPFHRFSQIDVQDQTVDSAAA
jgi:hypothetical protein